MEIVNIEASAFMEMNNILFKIEKQLKGLNSSKSYIRQKTVVFKTERANPLQSYRQKDLL